MRTHYQSANRKMDSRCASEVNQMIKKSALFQIIGFSSAYEGLNRSGFSIILDKDFAKEVSNLERPSGEHLTSMMLSMFKNTLGKTHIDPQSIRFFGDSWLLQSFHIGNDCACFSAGNLTDDFARHIRYSPHNIDSPVQASLLLGMWLLWFNNVTALTSYELPFCI